MVDMSRAEEVFRQRQSQGLLVTTWPDLPPEVNQNRELHANAWRLRHSYLYLPLHQSLSARELITKFHKPANKEKVMPGLKLIWDGVSRDNWHQLMVQSGRSTLTQSWPYGEAKSVDGGWRVRRGIFYLDDEPIAFVQALQKRVAGLLSIININRGPLFLKPLQTQEQIGVWAVLGRLGNLWCGRLLTVLPELNMSGSSQIMMGYLGFVQLSPNTYESLWLDLSLELDELRKQLDGKWRNMLTFSEKAGMTLEASNDEAKFNWMMVQYQHLMKAKDFSGPSVDFLFNLRRLSNDKEQLLILRAMHEGEPVAGICLEFHGAAATYLLGWNGDKGRNLKANQYLLWQAILYLKQSGLKWFDLGGVDEDKTPGITAFKLGLNGLRYELVGRYWKWK